MAAVSTCKSCGAPIVWTVTEAGYESMPIDVNPSALGNVRLLQGEGVLIPVARVCADATLDLFDQDDDGYRYVPHFATCPQASEWRKS